MQVHKTTKSKPAFSPNGKKYYGPTDGRSRRAPKWARRLSDGVLGLAYKVEIRGKDKLPDSGRHVFAASHPGYLDPLLLTKVTRGRDIRFMAAIENFGNPIMAKINEWAGAFPVNRGRPHPATMHHAESLFSEGASLGIFPEGKPSKEIGKLGPIKAGAALFAVKGQADSVVPIAMHYKESPGTSKTSKIKSLAKGALLSTCTLALGLAGGPLGVGATVLGGLLGGSGSGAKLARKFFKNPNVRTPFPKVISGALGAVTGSVAGIAGLAALTAATPALLAASTVGVAAGVGTYLWDQWSQGRDIAQVSIAEPLSVADFTGKRDTRQATQALGEALHQSIGGQLESLTGVPYDHSSPKLR